MATAPKPSLKLRMGQQQVMTPQLLQSIRLLQLTGQELEFELQQALESNLMLEVDESPRSSVSASAEATAEVASQSTHRDLADAEALLQEAAPSGYNEDAAAERIVDQQHTQAEQQLRHDQSSHQQVEADFDWSSSESWSSGAAVDEEGEPFTARIAEPAVRNPRMSALAQLQLIVADEHQAELVALIIDAVDDNGYLSVPLETIAEQTEGWQPTSEELMQALVLVQSVEPTGFGARDLRECLLLQLDAMPAVTRFRRLARKLVEHHLEALATPTALAALADELDATVQQLNDAKLLIRSLDPRPGASQLAETQAVVPEVLVTGRDGGWRVELNPETLPRVRINAMYERQIGHSSASAYRSLKEQLNEARWLVRGLQMRQETLLKVSEVIFERQREFLRVGEEAMVSLTLRDVAEAIQMHESTVCRVVANKYALTPWGVYPLKAFFPVPIEGAEQGTSATAVRAMIRKIIDSENRAAPLCDGEVAALLARRGIRLARRTVAKYRESMRIAPATQRQTSLRSQATLS